ncbi:MAG: hypothetical protein ACRDVO_08835 [Jiangellaceae bacterium]
MSYGAGCRVALGDANQALDVCVVRRLEPGRYQRRWSLSRGNRARGTHERCTSERRNRAGQERCGGKYPRLSRGRSRRDDDTAGRDLDGTEPRRVHHFPPPDPGRHGWAELLALVGDLRHLAYDRSLDDADCARRIRDRFGVYDGIIEENRGEGR